MKSRLKKTMVLTVFCSLSVFMSSANLSNPDEGWTNSPTTSSTILEQTKADRKPFGEDDASQAQLRAAPCGNGQKEVFVGEGIWAMIGLAIAYGVVRRNSQKEML